MAAPQKIFRFLRLMALNDWGRKLACLGLATLFWLYIDGELTAERTVTVKLTAADLRLPPNLFLSETSQSFTFRLQLNGPKDVAPERPKPQFDLSGLKVGPHALSAGPDRWRVPSFRVLSVEPKTFEVELVAADVKLLPVRVKPRGEVKAGYLLSEPTPVPREVQVRGPRDVLDAADAVWTEPIDVSGRSENFKADAELQTTVQIGDREAPVQLDQNKIVTVYFSIQPKPISVVLRNVKIFGLAPPGFRLTLEPEALSVTVTGPSGLVAKAVEAPGKTVRLFVEVEGQFAKQELSVKAFAPGLIVTGENGEDLPKINVSAVPDGDAPKAP
jgi:hypothetical protein